MAGGGDSSIAPPYLSTGEALRFARVAPPTLHVQLECELPDQLAVGLGTALFVCGWCFSPERVIRRLDFLLDGEPQPVAAQRMPRLDPFRALHPTLDPYATVGTDFDPASDEDPNLYSYRSGFWGIVSIPARDATGELELSLRAQLDDGSEVVAALASIPCRSPEAPLQLSWPAGGGEAPVAIAMATYNPPAELLQIQLDSIRAQTHEDWICVISDDCSSSDSLAMIREAIAGDERFVLSRSPKRLGFYRNFERALELVPEQARFVALADQDDAWHPDKLATLVESLGGARLVYSDARVVDRDGRVLADTWWQTRHNNHSDLLSLLVANAVTGAASLFDRELLDYALPFPPAQFAHFHDHWIGLVAASLGEIAYVPRPLYDYVQHGTASLGHAAANQMTSLSDRIRHRRGLSERVRMWRLHYFVDICRLEQFATVLSLRCGPTMSGPKRRVLERFLGAERSLPAVARLALRGARELVGTPETLGAEWMLFHALAWRRLLEASVRDRPQARGRLDALPPPSLIQAPGVPGLPEPVAEIARKIAPLTWAVSDDAPRRINLLIPTIDLQHLFGGYIGKFNLAVRLAQLGHRVRLVTTDPVGPLPSDWRRTVESYRGLEGLLDRVELAFGRESAQLEVSRDDGFIATTWWTAHIADQAVRSLGGDRFLYLIQEYEPFTFAHGTYAALAAESYELPHYALFSSELLRGYFRAHEIGVFAAGERAGDGASVAFENAITPVRAPSAAELGARRDRRLLFYGRPEPHAARNMFELGVLALSRAAADGVLNGWELHGIGSVGRSDSISVGGGLRLNLLPRSDQSTYGEMLGGHDVGLALMYTPHPSLVPIEMASAGMLTVTSSFENKTAEAMASISGNLITVAPTVAGVAGGIRRAVDGVTDLAGREAGSRVRWSSSWEHSFPDAMLEAIVGELWPR
jgi:GT2 family glycosyltransferase